MALRDVVIARETVHVDDSNSFDVRGLSYADAAAVVSHYGPEASSLFDQLVEDGGKGMAREDVVAGAKAAVMKFPNLVAALIASAADEPDLFDTVRQLRFPVQVEAIEKMFQLTFTTEGELEKVVETITRGLQKVTSKLGTLSGSRSTLGSSESGAT